MARIAMENPGNPERWALDARDLELTLQDASKAEGWPKCKQCGRYFDPDDVGSDATPGLCDPCDDGEA